MKSLGHEPTNQYWQHHVFPNLLISHTDSLTLVQTVRPITGESSVTDVWQYARQSVRSNLISKITASLWGRFLGWLSYKILKEDIGIFSRVQRGEQAATDRAILGRCEERLNAFEEFLLERILVKSGCNSVADDGMKSALCETAPKCSQSPGVMEVTE